MRLTVLGGAAAGGNTGQGCSGYLVESDTTRLVLDLGPGTLQELRRHTDYRALHGIVLSHLHVDHVLDVVALRFALAYNPIKPAGRIPLWLPPGGLDVMSKLAEAFGSADDVDTYFSSVYDMAVYDPGERLPIGDLILSFAPTIHYIPCWAIRVERPWHGALAYTADTGPEADLARITSGAEVLIAEAADGVPDDEAAWATRQTLRGHLTAREAADLAQRASAQTLVLTHLWEERDIPTCLDAARAQFPGDVRLAEPGMTLTW